MLGMQAHTVVAHVVRPVLYFAAHSAWFFVTRARPRGVKSSRAGPKRTDRSQAEARRPRGARKRATARSRRTMTAQQRIVRVRRNYNQWVANQTMEDYALRFTPQARANGRLRGRQHRLRRGLVPRARSRRRHDDGQLRLHQRVLRDPRGRRADLPDRLADRLYAARYGVDMDLLTRGAGFGYIGSTITSLIYASFTFIFFALEAAIMALALELCFGIPLLPATCCVPDGHSAGHPRHHLHQPAAGLDAAGLAGAASRALRFHRIRGPRVVRTWTGFSGIGGVDGRSFDLVLFGAAPTVVLSLITQIGEQADYLRFMPRRQPRARLVDRLLVRRAGLGRARRAEDAGGVVPRLSRDRASGAAAARRRPDADVSGRLRIRVLVAAAGARVHRRFRRHLAAQDQRHQRLCRLARLVELLLAPHPQPSGPRGLARLQYRDRAAC